MTEWEQFTRALRRRAFAYRSVVARPTGYSYLGSISTDRFGAVEIELHFPDVFLLGFPRAYVVGDHEELQQYRFPHLGDDRRLCYEDGTLVFERHDAEGMIDFILDAVRATLNIHPETWDAEIFREFKSYWEAQETYLTELADGDEEATLYKMDKVRAGTYLIGSNAPIFHSFSKKSPYQQQQGFRLLKVQRLPSIRTVTWPPKSLVDILAWLAIHPKLGDRVRRALRDQVGEGVKDIGILLKVKEPSIEVGIRFPLPAGSRGRLRLQHRYPELFWRSLKQENPTLTRILATPLDFDRIFSRNNSTKPFLQDQRLCLVGCGTIGSNLAPLLLRSGAGIGKRGHLSLVDKDVYTLENFSRHRLGSWALGLNKSEALELELHHEAPFSAVRAFPHPVEKLNLFPDSDLVLDATGDLEMMRWISRQLIELKLRRRRRVPLLSFWVHGAGDAVCAFWQAANGKACHECLRLYHLAHPGIYPPVTGGYIVDSCHSVFTPFSMNVSQHASTLAFSALLIGLERPFRTSFLLTQPFEGPSSGVRLLGAVRLLELPPNPECVVCGTNSIPD